MAESAASQYEDQFICSVCLDRLKEPVTIPCGHSYCMSCITDCWGQKEQEPPYCCPQCRESFSQRPLLKKNTLIAEMMETLQKTSLQTAAVECDVCTTEKSRAVKSCLQCLASFCQTHLQLHYQSPAFMKHKLVQASRYVQENVCLKWTSKKDKLKEIKVACQKLIEERERGQQDLSEAVKSFKSSAQAAVENIEKVFTEFICSLEKKRSEIKEQIRDQEKTEIDRAEKLHKHLDQELTELRKTQAEIEKLLITDQIHCLKSCQSVCVLPSYEDVPSFTQHTHLSFKDISISAFREVLEEVCQQQTATISREVSDIHVVEPPKPESPNDFLQYFRQLHLDPNTVQKKLKLSEGNRKVSSSNVVQQYPDHPERFDVYYNVLCTEGLYGRCYWEVECCGNDWSVAVSYKEISRKGQSNDCRLGFNNKSWRLTHCFQDFYVRHDDKQVNIIPFHSSRIGVYLDHRAGTLCFYSVSDTMTLLYTFQTKFTEPLYPAFGIGEGSIKIIEQRKSHK
uniref:Uncharacterized protein n=1 Tax=Cyprinus carpio TaxID=7962 RepID=A0A8C2GU04_CYPCA